MSAKTAPQPQTGHGGFLFFFQVLFRRLTFRAGQLTCTGQRKGNDSFAVNRATSCSDTGEPLAALRTLRSALVVHAGEILVAL